MEVQKMLVWIILAIVHLLSGIVLAETKRYWGGRNKKDYVITVIFEPITFTAVAILGVVYLIFLTICCICNKHSNKTPKTKVVKS